MVNDLVELADSSGRVSRSFMDRLMRDNSSIYRGNIGRYKVWIYTQFSEGKIEFQNLIISDSETPIIVYYHNPSKNDGLFKDLKTQATESIPPDVAINRILLSYLN